MDTHWIPLLSIPATGKTLVFKDETLWRKLLDEFALACRIIDPLLAEIFVLPQEQGVLFRGHISGAVALPCDRCADDSAVSINHLFDSFEAYQAQVAVPAPKELGRKAPAHKEHARDEDEADISFDDVDEAVIRNAPHGRGIEINPAALAWEEFLLALPVKPLCKDSCKGLCPVCGNNLNNESCSCAKEQGDPRLAVLRNLTVKK